MPFTRPSMLKTLLVLVASHHSIYLSESFSPTPRLTREVSRGTSREIPRFAGGGPPEDAEEGEENKFWNTSLRSDLRRALLVSTSTAVAYNILAATVAPRGFVRVPTQFIAAIGDPGASEGTGAENWGLWPVDPGPRGVQLDRYDELERSGGISPSGWTFDRSDWWLEEHGLIMESPAFPLAPGRYLVTGGRLVTTVLTIFPPELAGESTQTKRWKIDDSKLYDVTHLPCRAARYHPSGDGSYGSPAGARRSDFPVTPGSEMPSVEGCDKQDYAVLFVIGVESS